jgi:hypothetical protein
MTRHKRARAIIAAIALLVGLVAGPAAAVAAPLPPSPQGAVTAADCPPGVRCQVVLAGLKDGGCNWSPASRPVDLPIYGVHMHTTEGSLEDALAEAQDTGHCVSWNYLVGQDGTVYVSVPARSLSYDVGNWWFNTHYVEVEHIGRAEDCSTITPAEYLASVKLTRYLIWRFGITPTSANINGHDSVPGVRDRDMPVRHWDPGVCWPWAAYLAAVGAPIVPTALPGSSVVTINVIDSRQPVQDCPGLDANKVPTFTGCMPPAQRTTNFVTLRTGPSDSAPLLSDPYLHPDGAPGTIAAQDWGDKAPVGHSYVVAQRQSAWMGIWYSGKLAWFKNTGFTVPTGHVKVVTPKGNTAVPIYGRPMPEPSAPGWASIPYDLQTQVALTKYSLLPGQQYVVAQVADPRTDYAEGCNKADCSGPGDTTVVIGNDQYVEVSWGHHYAFVRAQDVTVS